MKYYVYVYLDPRKKGKYYYENICFLFEPFYVGKGSRLRYKSHLYEAYKEKGSSNKLKSSKIRKIRESGKTPIIVLAQESLSEKEAFAYEEKLIREIGRIDLKSGSLSNFSYGGEGSSGRIVSKETRLKIKNKAKGRKHSELTKSKMKKNNEGVKNPNFGNKGEKSCWFGKKHSEESKQKMKKNGTGISRKRSKGSNLKEATKNKIGKANSKAVKLILEDGKEIDFPKMVEAISFTGLTSKEIRRLASTGERSKRKKYRFKLL